MASRGRNSLRTAPLSSRQGVALAASQLSTWERTVGVMLSSGLKLDGLPMRRKPRRARSKSSLRARSLRARRPSCGIACLTCALQAFELTSGAHCSAHNASVVVCARSQQIALKAIAEQTLSSTPSFAGADSVLLHSRFKSNSQR